MKIFLIGFMGAGKSSIGKLLAERLNMNFYDTDLLIEKKERISTNDIFQKYGESYFRDVEKKVITEVCSNCDNSVIATGGGCVLNDENVFAMKKNGKLIFLDASLENIMSRVANDNSRPLLHKVSFSDRHLIYERLADLIVNADLSMESVCNQIVCALSHDKNPFYLIAGPCVVESSEQIDSISQQVKNLGATHLRGGTFKLRTSPDSFSGLGKDGLTLLMEAKKKTGLPIVTEITRISQIKDFENVDVIQVGARNAQNFELLKELGKTRKTILLKRGFSMTVKDFLLSAQYVINEGNENIILCERGISSFEIYTRNTLDISAVPILKKLSGLPVIVDPSHAAGKSWLVESLSLAAVAAGADGLIIEVHNDRNNSRCDGEQSLTPSEFENVIKKVLKIRKTI